MSSYRGLIASHVAYPGGHINRLIPGRFISKDDRQYFVAVTNSTIQLFHADYINSTGAYITPYNEPQPVHATIISTAHLPHTSSAATSLGLSSDALLLLTSTGTLTILQFLSDINKFVLFKYIPLPPPPDDINPYGNLRCDHTGGIAIGTRSDILLGSLLDPSAWVWLFKDSSRSLSLHPPSFGQQEQQHGSNTNTHLLKTKLMTVEQLSSSSGGPSASISLQGHAHCLLVISMTMTKYIEKPPPAGEEGDIAAKREEHVQEEQQQQQQQQQHVRSPAVRTHTNYNVQIWGFSPSNNSNTNIEGTITLIAAGKVDSSMINGGHRTEKEGHEEEEENIIHQITQLLNEKSKEGPLRGLHHAAFVSQLLLGDNDTTESSGQQSLLHTRYTLLQDLSALYNKDIKAKLFEQPIMSSSTWKIPQLGNSNNSTSKAAAVYFSLTDGTIMALQEDEDKDSPGTARLNSKKSLVMIYKLESSVIDMHYLTEGSNVGCLVCVTMSGDVVMIADTTYNDGKKNSSCFTKNDVEMTDATTNFTTTKNDSNDRCIWTMVGQWPSSSLGSGKPFAAGGGSCQLLLGDCLVADAENLQQNQLYALSPAPPSLSSIQRFFPLSTNCKNATLHVMYPATRPELLLETDDDVFQGVYAMWSASPSSSSSSSSSTNSNNKSAVVVISTMNESRALKLENETLIDCSDALGIQLSEKTLVWDAMESGWMVQITPTRVWFIAPKSSSSSSSSLEEEEEEEEEESVCWCPPANQSIITGSICSQYDTVLVCVHDGSDNTYRIVALLRSNVRSGAIAAATETAEQDVCCCIINADVSCMSNAMVLLPKTSSRKEAIVAIGTHTPAVHLLKLSLSADNNNNDHGSNDVTLTRLTEVAVELRPVPCAPFSPSCSNGKETPGNYQQQQQQQKEGTTAVENNMVQTDAPPTLSASPLQPTMATPRAAAAPIRALSSPLAAAAAADPLAAWQHIPESLLLLPLPPSSLERKGLKVEDVVMAVGLRTGQLVQLFMKITRDTVVSSEEDIEIMLGSRFIEIAAGKQPVKLIPLTGNSNSRYPHLASPVALALGDRALLIYPSNNSKREEERPSSLHRLSLKPLALPPILAAASLSVIMTAEPRDTTTTTTTTTKNGYHQCLVYSTSEGRLSLISLSHLHSATAANTMATTTTRHIDLDVMHARRMALHPQSGVIAIVGATLNPDDKITRLCTTVPAIQLIDPVTGQVPQWSSDAALTTALKSPRGDSSSSSSSRDGRGDQVQINNNWGRCHEALSALALSQFKNIPSLDDEVSIAIKELSSHVYNSHGQPAESVEDTTAAAMKKRQHEAMSFRNNNIGAGSRAASAGFRSAALRSHPVLLIRNNNNNSSKRRRREAGIPPSPRGYMRHHMEQQLHAKIDSLHTNATASGGGGGGDDDDEEAAEEDALLSFMFVGTDVRYSDNQIEASTLQSVPTIGERGAGTRQGQFSHESMKKVVVMDESGERLGGRILCVSWSTDFNDHTEDIEEEEEGDKGKEAANPNTTAGAPPPTTNQVSQNLSNNGNPHIKLSLVDMKRFDTPILSMCIINLPLHVVDEDQQQGVLPSSSLSQPPAAAAAATTKRGRVRLIVATGRHLVSYPILRSGKLGNKVAVICTDRPITYLHWHPSRSSSNNSNITIKGHVVGTDGKNGALVWQYHAGDEKPNVDDGSKVATQPYNNNANKCELSSSFLLGKNGEAFVLRAVDTEVRTHCLGALFINNNDDDNYNSSNSDECSRVETRCVLADGNGSLSVVRPERRIGKLVHLGNTSRHNTGSIATKLLPQGFKFGTTTTANDGNSSSSIIPNNNNFSLVCDDGRVIQFASSVPYDAVAMPLWKLQSYMAHHPLTAPLSGCDYEEYVGGRVVGVPGRGVSLLKHPLMMKKKKEEEEEEEGTEGAMGEGMEGKTNQEHTTTTGDGDGDGDGADASASSGDGQQPLAEALNGALTLTGGSRSIDAMMTLTTTTTATADEMITNTIGNSTLVGDLILDLNMLQLYEQLPYRDQVDLAMAVMDTGSEEGRGGEEEEEEKEGASSLPLLYVEWVLDLIYKARQYVS